MVKKIKLKNFILAQAIADSFGYLIEFKNKEEIIAMYGKDGLKWETYKNNEVFYVSDDTQMSLFALNACLTEGFEKEDTFGKIWKNYKDWKITQDFDEFDISKNELFKFKELFHKRAPGNTCLYALSGNKMGSIHNPLNDSKGCGGIMRTGVYSFFARHIQEAFEWGVAQAALTHGHPSAFLSAGFYSGLVYGLINDLTLEQAWEQAEETLVTYHGHKTLLQKLHTVKWLINHSPELKGETLTKELGEGWYGDEALIVAIYCAQTSISWEEVIEKAANHKGDSDSTAMLAAGLWVLRQSNNDVLNTIDDFGKKIDVKNAIDYLLSKVKEK